MKDEIAFWATIINANIYNATNDYSLAMVWLIFGTIIFIVKTLKKD